MERLRSWLANIILVILSIIATILYLEIILRFTSYKDLLLKDNRVRYYYRVDREKGYDIKPNIPPIFVSADRVPYHIWSNELGCFDRPYCGEKNYILLLGDSFAHMFAPFKDKWGTQIEDYLQCRVLKCGVSGYGTFQEYLKAKEIIDKVKNRPQLIIVAYFLNDLDDDCNFPNYTVYDGFLVSTLRFKDPLSHEVNWKLVEQQKNLWQWLIDPYPLTYLEMEHYLQDRYSIAANLFNRLFAPFFESNHVPIYKFMGFSNKPEMQGIWQKHFENLKLFQGLALQNKAHLILVIIPLNWQVYPFLANWPETDPERPQKILHQFLEAQGICYLDLLPFFRKYADQTPRHTLDSRKDLYWRTNSHWSTKGEHLAGLLVSLFILQKNLVQVPDREKKLEALEEKLREFR